MLARLKESSDLAPGLARWVWFNKETTVPAATFLSCPEASPFSPVSLTLDATAAAQEPRASESVSGPFKTCRVWVSSSSPSHSDITPLVFTASCYGDSPSRYENQGLGRAVWDWDMLAPLGEPCSQDLSPTPPASRWMRLYNLSYGPPVQLVFRWFYNLGCNFVMVRTAFT